MFETLVSVLGFTTTEGIIWNGVAYLAVLMAIVAVLWPRARNVLFFFAGGALAVYSGMFLENVLFMTLQSVLAISAALKFFKKISDDVKSVILSLMGVAAIVFLTMTGHLSSDTDALGLFGFIALTVGITRVPRPYAFLAMALGGMLLVWYAWLTVAWAFLILNVFFVLANIWQWTATLLDSRFKK